MKNHMDPHFKFDVNSTKRPPAKNGTASKSDASEPPPQKVTAQQPSSSSYTGQFNSPEAVSPRTNEVKCYSPYAQEEISPFVEHLLPLVRASAYPWFHLQAAKRRYQKANDRKMTAAEEKATLAQLQNDRDELKVKWASRLLSKLKKDIHADYKDTFVSVISGIESDKCVLSDADQRGKMRRIDCQRQADKVWRLDLVTIILFKGIPLESTDGERLERIDTCRNALCINPFHLSITVRGLDIFMANYLKGVETKITLNQGPPEGFIKQEPGEVAIPQPHRSTATTHHAWKSDEPLILTYDPVKASHTYFGGRATLQQTGPNPYAVLENKNAIDNNYYDSSRSALCLPPPPPLSCVTETSNNDPQSMEISEDSNDGTSTKRSRDLSSHDSPNSSTNEEVRNINSNRGNLLLGQNSSIWQATDHYQRSIASRGASDNQMPDYRDQESLRNPHFPKSVRRMRVNDVPVLVVDERNHQDSNVNPQTLMSALNSLHTRPNMTENLIGRKRTHPGTSSPFDFLNRGSDLQQGGNGIGSDLSPPHAVVSNLISRECSGFMASPTKFTTAKGVTTSFSKILQNIEEKDVLQQQQQHEQNLQNQPSTSFASQPPNLTSKPARAHGHVKLVAPIALKPQMMSISACNSVVASPITTPRITPYRMLDDETSLITALGLANNNSNDSTLILDENFLQHFIETNSRSPLLNAATTFPPLAMGTVNGTPNVQPARPDSSASNGSNSLGAVMGLIVPQALTLVVPQTETISPLQQVRMGIGDPPACSPSSSNSSLGAANQAPISSTPKDPNAPKLPTDFSQALNNQTA